MRLASRDEVWGQSTTAHAKVASTQGMFESADGSCLSGEQTTTQQPFPTKRGQLRAPAAPGSANRVKYDVISRAADQGVFSLLTGRPKMGPKTSLA